MATRKLLSADAYTVGLIYVKPLEMKAISVMLDEFHQSVPIRLGDDNEYTLGRIGKHNIAIAGPPRGSQGKAAIADVVGRIYLTFKNVRVGLLVGIGGGVPHLPMKDVRLGDVVVGAPEVGPAVIQYDLGKQLPKGIEVTRTINKPPALLLRVVDKVENAYQIAKYQEHSFFAIHLQRYAQIPRMKELHRRPPVPDRLFLANYNHEDGTQCSSHDNAYEVERPVRNPEEIRVHYSTILSGDLVMKSGEIRDQISTNFHDALCFEMEAAGLMDTFPCLVIRGICDYSDSHKNKDWQEYAAATAAAYAREILLSMAERIVEDFKSSPASKEENALEDHLQQLPLAFNTSMASSCPIKDLEGTPLVASTSMNYEGMEVKDSARAYFGNSSNETNTTHTGSMDAAAMSSNRYVGRDSNTTYGPNSTFHFTTIINDTRERDNLQKETLEAQSKKVDDNIQQGAQDRERLKREFDTAANGSTLYTVIRKLVNPFGWGALWDALWAVYTGQGRAIDDALGREENIARNLSGTVDASQENMHAILALLGAVLSAQRKAEADMIEARRQLMDKVIEIQGLEEADNQSYKQEQSVFRAQAEVEKQKQEQAATESLIAELRERERQWAQEKEQYEKAGKEAKELLKEVQKTNLDAERARDKILKEMKALQEEKAARIEREKQELGWLRSIFICFERDDD